MKQTVTVKLEELDKLGFVTKSGDADEQLSFIHYTFDTPRYITLMYEGFNLSIVLKVNEITLIHELIHDEVNVYFDYKNEPEFDQYELEFLYEIIDRIMVKISAV